DGEALDNLTAGVHHRDRVVVASPIHACGTVARPGHAKGVLRRMLHISLLAARPSGEAPFHRCRDAAARSLTDRRSQALSPIDGRRVPGDPRASQTSCWTFRVERAGRWPGGTSGASAAPQRATDITRVHQ